MTLSGRQKSELTAIQRSPGLWSGVEPYQCDADLDFYLRHGLVRHMGAGKGYEITEIGSRALSAQERDDGR